MDQNKPQKADFPITLFQGKDFKARNWMNNWPAAKTVHFVSLKQLAGELLSPRSKIVVFRYMNSNRRFSGDVLHVLFLWALVVLRPLIRLKIFWILHNIDRETLDRRPSLTSAKRAALRFGAQRIYVLDNWFKEQYFSDNPQYEAISFGPKTDGSLKAKTRVQLEKFAGEYDQVALCLGAVGAKYKHFSNIKQLSDLARLEGVSLGFVVPTGVQIEGVGLLEIDEPNIDETKISDLVDFSYRINDDVSMPFTIYAACTAGIPLVSSKNYFTYQILKRYGIGVSDQEWFKLDQTEIAELRKNMKKFIDRKSWNSLRTALTNEVLR